MGRDKYNGYRDLKVFHLAYKLTMEFFEIVKSFPKEEKHFLVDQTRRSSHSIPANIAEAWKKRRYHKISVSKLIDSAGESGETDVWLDISKDLGYILTEQYEEPTSGYDEINRIL